MRLIQVKLFDIGYSIGFSFMGLVIIRFSLPFQIGHSRYRKLNGVPWWSSFFIGLAGIFTIFFLPIAETFVFFFMRLLMDFDIYGFPLL